MVDVNIIKEGGLVLVAFILAFWSWTLWTRVKELESTLLALNATCLACARTHAERLLELGNGAVKAIEHSTEAISASHRQEDIMAQLTEMRSAKRATKSIG